MGDGMARADTLMYEEGGQKKVLKLVVYSAGKARRKRHK